MEGFVRGLLLGIGTVAVPIGLLWLAQGLGLIHWPASSFMLDQARWARIGGLVAVMGVVLVWVGWRMGIARETLPRPRPKPRQRR